MTCLFQFPIDIKVKEFTILPRETAKTVLIHIFLNSKFSAPHTYLEHPSTYKMQKSTPVQNLFTATSISLIFTQGYTCCISAGMQKCCRIQLTEPPTFIVLPSVGCNIKKNSENGRICLCQIFLRCYWTQIQLF